MRLNRRRGSARLLNGTILGFLVMLGLLGLTTYLLFTVRSDLDVAKQDDVESAAEIQRQTQGRTSAEAQVAGLQQQQVSLQEQVDTARIARGVAEEATRRETATRTAAEQQSINLELAKIEAQQLADQKRQGRISAEEAAQQAEEAVEAARRATSVERLAKQRLERQLVSERNQARMDVAREEAMGELVLRGIVNGLVTYTVDELPDYAAEGIDEVILQVNQDLATWTTHGFNISVSGPQETPDFTIGWVRDAGGHLEPVAGETNRVLVPLGETNCVGDWVAYDSETIRRLLWHELGHAFGYGNSDDPTNVMHAELQTKFAENRTVELVLAPNITHVIPLCGAGIFNLLFDEPLPGQSYQFAVLKPGVTAQDDYFDDDNHYMGCSSTPTLYTNECIVEDGAALLVFTQVAIDRIKGVITKNYELPEITMEWDPSTFRYSDAELAALRSLFS